MIQSTPTDHRAAQAQERLVDVGAFVVAHRQTTELVQQCQGLLDDVAQHAQAAAMFGVTLGDRTGDAASAQFTSMPVAVVRAVGQWLPRQ